MTDADDRRYHYPATARNREPIAEVLGRHLPEEGALLEIGAGSGEHAAHLAPRWPRLSWQPSDPDPGARSSIDAWAAASSAKNLRSALALDAAATPWPIDQVDAILAINVIHIAPWTVAQGIFAGAGRHLRGAGFLYLYGPYRIAGAHTAPSNAAFDASLRARDPRWGVRDLEEVVALGEAAGLHLVDRVAMPANNLSLVFNKK